MSEQLTPDQSALLIESEERYRTLIENASDLIQSVRPDGTFEFVNKAWYDRLGYTPEEVANMHVWDIIHPDSFDSCMVHFEEAVKGTPLDNLGAVFMAKDGSAVPVEGDAHSRFLDGKVIATHSIFRDITERVRAEELQRRNDQLEREQHARYLEKMAALGKLSAGLSHELNNPAAAAQRAASLLDESVRKRDRAESELTALHLDTTQLRALTDLVDRCLKPRLSPGELSLVEISRREEAIEDRLAQIGLDQPWLFAPGFVQAGIGVEDLDGLATIMPAEALSPAVRWVGESLNIQEQTQVIISSTKRISDLVSAVKAYSFRDQATEQIVDIHDGLEDTLTILAYRLRGMTIHRDYDRTLPKIHTRGSGLNQVWTNILDNAVDATDGHGTITIKTYRQDDSAVVEISDDGSGIPHESLTRIFEPFYTTKPQGHGTGLGLDIAWRIVTEDHNGEISVESEPGHTVFRIVLPITEA